MSIFRTMFKQISNLATKVESWWSLVVLLMSTGSFAWLVNQWDALSSQGWAAVLFVAILAACILMLAVSTVFFAFTRGQAAPRIMAAGIGAVAERPETTTIDQPQAPLKMLVNLTMENQTVVIDGHHYVKCVFKNCTLQYSGGNYQLTECRREAGETTFATYNQVIVATMPILQFAGLMREDGKGTLIVVPKDAFKA